MVASQKSHSCPLTAQHSGIKHHRGRLRGARTLGHASCRHRARCAGVTVVCGVRRASKGAPSRGRAVVSSEAQGTGRVAGVKGRVIASLRRVSCMCCDQGAA